LRPGAAEAEKEYEKNRPGLGVKKYPEGALAIIPANELKKGFLYRIEHRKNSLPSRLGRFVRLDGAYPNVNAMFSDLRGPSSPTMRGYRVDEWIFRKSGQTAATEKGAVAIGLPLGDVDPNKYNHALPDELEREVNKYGGKGRRTRRHRRRRRKTGRKRKGKKTYRKTK